MCQCTAFTCTVAVMTATTPENDHDDHNDDEMLLSVGQS